MNCLLVIPARWGSSRLPGKPLRLIAGRSLLARTIDLARRALHGLDESDIDVVVATDNRQVAAEAERLHCDVALTDASLTSGSARVLAAARLRTRPPDYIVNLQGDAPLLPVGAIRGVLNALKKRALVVTPVVRLSWANLDLLRAHKLKAPFSGTTCIVGDDGKARWFSKQIIPAIRDEAAARRLMTASPVYRHLGLYGYKLDALQRFEAAQPSWHEKLEGLEQLRFFDLGIPIDAVVADESLLSMGGIDTLDDVALAEALIAQHGDPYGQ